jgi:GMP synthase-like glutamine amidotransferase
MRILSLVHGPLVRPELFGDVARAEGHELDEWSVADESAPPRPVEEYDSVFVFGGHMNVDEESEHPWLRGEDELVRRLVARNVPLLGVCLGGQLLAKAAGAHVGPSPEPEAGFVRTVLTERAAGDPIFGSLPREFDVFAMHEYAFHVPAEGVELARSSVCSQAFRLGECAWALQFHPEVRLEQVEEWLRDDRLPNSDDIVAELRDRLDEWQAFGAGLCRAFLAVAERPTQVLAASSSRRDHSCHEPA